MLLSLEVMKCHTHTRIPKKIGNINIKTKMFNFETCILKSDLLASLDLEYLLASQNECFKVYK